MEQLIPVEKHSLPNDIDAEKAVLAAVLLEREAFYLVSDFVYEDSFFLERHQLIWRAIHDLIDSTEPVDIITVTNRLRENGNLEKVGGAFYVTQVTTTVSLPDNIEKHGKILAELALRRGSIKLALELLKVGDLNEDVFDYIDAWSTRFDGLQDGITGSKIVSFGDTVKKLYDQIAYRSENPGEMSGIPSGISDLDKKTLGWQKSDLIILAGRPGMGKTAIAAAFARAAAKENVPVGFFTLEMSDQQVGNRIMAAEFELSSEFFRTANSIEDMNVIAKMPNKKVSWPIYIDDTPALRIIELRSRARRLKNKLNLGLIIVDYLQLMSGSKAKYNSSANREQEVSEISRGLKALAKELNVPVIALSQMSRAVEMRGGDKKPRLSDLRESGSIEQDADMVIFAYRPEYYDIMETEDGYSTAGLIELIISKHRNGDIGTVNAKFIGKYTNVKDFSSSNGEGPF